MISPVGVGDVAQRLGTARFLPQTTPRDNGFIESFYANLLDEFLGRVDFDTLLEAKVLIERRTLGSYRLRNLHSLSDRVLDPEVEWLLVAGAARAYAARSR
ncbi:hypothetical protein EP7_001412 [Isosphaeraceae bacterium EP7]